MSEDHAAPVSPSAPQQDMLQTTMALRLNADNLPRHGLYRSLPDTYAVVTSVSGRTSKGRSGPILNIVSDTNTNHTTPTTGLGHEQIMRKTEWGRTEIVHKSSRPQWTTTFPLTYEYGSECYFFVRVFRLVHPTGGSRTSKGPGDNTKDDQEGESLGDAIFEIGDILGSKHHTKIKRLPKGGVVFCRLEPIQKVNQNRIFRFKFAACNLLVGRHAMSKLSPFANAPDTIFQISKQPSTATSNSQCQASWIVVYRSSPVENSLDPTWDIGQVDLASACHGDWDRPLRLAVLVHKKMAQDVMIGECETTLRMILNTQRDNHSTASEQDASHYGFVLQRNISKKPNKHVGRLLVKLAQVMDLSDDENNASLIEPPFALTNDYGNNATLINGHTTNDPYTIDMAALPTPMAAPATFQDYINGGWKLDFYIAIDFTSSNGDPRIPGTLHDQNPITLNDYEETMVSIGNAVSPYTERGALSTTVWGFGCKFDGALRHIFQCGNEPKVSGVDGILRAYKSVFEADLTMSGPTCFDEVIQAAAVQARKHQQSKAQLYSVLLVITDGISPDVQETKRKLGVYSTVPLSIIFVGVGRADFGRMYQLVAPSGAHRENATFCDFRQHQHDPSSLGRSALQHLPAQFVHYMLQNNISP